MCIHCYFNSCCCPRSSTHGKFVTAADRLTFDPVLSATHLVVWQYAKAAQVCPVEVSTPTCSVTASLLLSWRLSQRLGVEPLHTLWGEFNTDAWEYLNGWEHLIYPEKKCSVCEKKKKCIYSSSVHKYKYSLRYFYFSWVFPFSAGLYLYYTKSHSYILYFSPNFIILMPLITSCFVDLYKQYNIYSKDQLFCVGIGWGKTLLNPWWNLQAAQQYIHYVHINISYHWLYYNNIISYHNIFY